MTDVDVAVADAIPPVDEDDMRVPVADLIKEHRSKIDYIRAKIEKEPLYDSTKHDDLWCLRFHLSHKKSKKDAVKAARDTLKFRAKYDLDDHDIRDHPPYEALWDEARMWYKFTNESVRHTIPDKKRGVVIYMNLIHVDIDGMEENLDDHQLLTQHLYNTEWTHQWLDYVTRTTGLLTKSIRVVDVKGVGREKINLKFGKRYSGVTDQMEDFYPQLLEFGYVVNPVAWMKLFWDMVRPYLPKRVAAKIDFIIPAENPNEKERLYKYVSDKNLPEKFGGQNCLSFNRLM